MESTPPDYVRSPGMAAWPPSSTWAMPNLPPEALPDPKPADVTAQAIRRARDKNILRAGPLMHASRSRTPLKGNRVGRNEPCPCGSGKKYKLCHMNGPPKQEYQPPTRKPAPVNIPGATITTQEASTQ